ncbi:invertebrate-type lysozyme 6-like isoform X1 [Periplaneta americana]|uniref:invertebrate-type lysozyme 6-like isoform X1 n=1 Tax=Periplaneta americana TaxID=6978 RepID=UPI0037E76880
MKWSSIILCLLLAVRGNEVPEECLTCICEAASECDLRTTCGDSLCGPFGISRGFWLDSGSLGNKSQYPACCSQPSGMASVETNLWNRHQLIQLDTHHTDWESCSLDLECAVKTVKRTFERYWKDCDGNGSVDCHDFARIHYMGAESCTKEAPADFVVFQRTMDTCLDEIGASDLVVDRVNKTN